MGERRRRDVQLPPSRYTKYSYVETPNLKGKHAKADPARMMKEEASVADKHLQGVDHLVLLDEHGPQMGSSNWPTTSKAS